MPHTISKAFKYALALGLVLAGGTAHAEDHQSVEDFYSGRTMDMIIGYAPGGAFDQYARLISRFLPQFIPGNPDIVPRNMPGGGTRTAAGYLNAIAPQDGSVLGTLDNGLPLEQVMDINPVEVNVADFGFIGSPMTSNNVLIVWHTTGVETLEEAREREITIGSTSSLGAQIYPLVLNARQGTQFRVIAGYPGGNDINMAMEQGEVDGRGSNAWAAYMSTSPEWFENDLASVLVQVGPRREPDLPDVPTLVELADNEQDEAMFRLLSGPVALGRPILTTPNVPEDRLQALRDAFDLMVRDPEFLAAAEAQNLEISPASGVELQQVVEEIINADPATIQALVDIVPTE